jgi:hypothetical protein
VPGDALRDVAGNYEVPVGRTNDVRRLADALDAPTSGASLTRVVGPRGSGKTVVLSTVLAGRPALHLQVADLTAEDLLADLRLLAGAVLGRMPVARRPGVLPMGPGRGEWQSFLMGIADHMAEEGEPFVLALDGYEALVGAHRRIGEELGEFLEAASLRELPLRLVLTGRSATVFDDIEMGEGAGVVTTETIQLGAIPYRVAGWGQGGAGPRDAFRRWALLGDHPAHYREGTGDEALEETIVRRVLRPDGDLFDAPLGRLEAAFRRPARYAAVLRALSRGPLDWSGVLREAGGIDTGAQLAPYLRGLEEEGLVRADLPLGAPEGSRARRYSVVDPYLAFWFGWVLPWRSLIPSLGGREVWSRYIEPELGTHFQSWMEEGARRWIAEHSEESFGAPTREVGALWGGEADFPVAGRLANGQVVYGLVDWDSASGMPPRELPREMVRRMRDTRYGIGRQSRVALYFLAGDPGEAIRRSVARESFARVVRLEDLMGDPEAPEREKQGARRRRGSPAVPRR